MRGVKFKYSVRARKIGGFSDLTLEQFKFKLEKNIGIQKSAGKVRKDSFLLGHVKVVYMYLDSDVQQEI